MLAGIHVADKKKKRHNSYSMTEVDHSNYINRRCVFVSAIVEEDSITKRIKTHEQIGELCI